jgi:hypothetical protein
MSTAIMNWYPSREQITESGDQFLGWSTRVLMGIADRVTPAHQRDHWVATATDGFWQWNAQDELWEKRERDQRTGCCEVTAQHSDDNMRDYVTEQLESYGVDRTAVNTMKS